jgi:hypothetical protein
MPLQSIATKNPNCDNDKCRASLGEVRLLPTGGGGNAILCYACYEHEMRYRRSRNMDLAVREPFDTPPWESLKVYDA